MKEKVVNDGTALLCRSGHAGGGKSVKIFRSKTDLTVVGEVTPDSIVVALGPPDKINGTSMVPIKLQGLVELYLFDRAPDRRELISAVFQACDVNQDGVLSAWEMFRLALCLEFPGTLQDWADEFGALCEDVGVNPDSGLSEHAFTCCLNDTESYFYCSDEQLSSMLKMLPQAQSAAALKLSRTGLVSEVFRACDVDQDGRLGQEELGRVAMCLGFPGLDAAWAAEYNALCAALCAGSGAGGKAGMDLGAFRRLLSEAKSEYYCTDTQLVSMLAALNWDRALETAALQVSRSPGEAVKAAKTFPAPTAGPPKRGLCRCGNVWAPDMAFCPACGSARESASREEEAVTCWRCNNTLASGMAFCPKCGTKRPATAKEREEAAIRIERAERKRQKKKKAAAKAGPAGDGAVVDREKLKVQVNAAADTGPVVQEQLEVVANKGDSTLGFTPRWPPGVVIIEKVTKKSWAEKVGIQVGAELMAMNGEAVNTMDKKIFVKRMQQRPLTLTMKLPPPPVLGAADEEVAAAPTAPIRSTIRSVLPFLGRSKTKEAGRSLSPSPSQSVKEKKAEKKEQERIEKERQRKRKAAAPLLKKGRKLTDKEASKLAEQITNGTMLICTEKESASMFESVQDLNVIGSVQLGDRVKATGKVEKVDGFYLVPIHDHGAVQLDLFALHTQEEKTGGKLKGSKAQQEEDAAVKIQSRVRGRNARKDVEKRKAKKKQEADKKEVKEKIPPQKDVSKEERAAIKIEAAERGRVARKRSNELREQKSKEEEEQKAKEEKAAIKIEAAQRGHMARKQTRELRAKKAVEGKAEATPKAVPTLSSKPSGSSSQRVAPTGSSSQRVASKGEASPDRVPQTPMKSSGTSSQRLKSPKAASKPSGSSSQSVRNSPKAPPPKTATITKKESEPAPANAALPAVVEAAPVGDNQDDDDLHF